MAKNITITFAILWDIEDANGGKCCLCSDARFFGKQARMIIIMDGEDKTQEQALCQSCASYLQTNETGEATES